MNSKNGNLENRNLSFNSIIENIKNGVYQIPDIQRGLVWTNEQKTKLMYTLLNRFPYGAIILGKTNKYPEYTFIIDGLQRITTMIDIYYNPFKYIDKKMEENILDSFIKKYYEYCEEENQLLNLSIDDKEKLKKIGQKMIGNVKQITKIDNLPCDEDVENNLNFDDFNKKRIIKDFIKVYEEFKKLIFDGLYIQIQEYRGTEEDISEIFQVINEQGKPLTDIEILKSKLSRYKIEKDFKDKENINIFKKKVFENILAAYEFKNDNATNNNISIFDYFFYIVYNIFNSNEISREFKDSPILNNIQKNVDNNKSNNFSMEWFKIVRFILNIIYNYNDNIEDEIINFFEDSKKNDVDYRQIINKISDLIIKTFNELDNIIHFPNYKIFDLNRNRVGKPKNKNFKFDNSESFLLIGSFMKLVKNNKCGDNYVYKNIFKHIIKYAYTKPFSSSSYENAFSLFVNDDMLSDINISDVFDLETEFNDNNAILKIITPLILLNNDKCEYLFYTKFIDDNIFNKVENLENKHKDLFAKSICNYFVFISNNDNQPKINSIIDDYFYQKSTNENLKNEYKTKFEKILNSHTLSYNDLSEFKNLRIKLLFDGE